MNHKKYMMILHDSIIFIVGYYLIRLVYGVVFDFLDQKIIFLKNQSSSFCRAYLTENIGEYKIIKELVLAFASFI